MRTAVTATAAARAIQAPFLGPGGEEIVTRSMGGASAIGQCGMHPLGVAPSQLVDISHAIPSIFFARFRRPRMR